METTRGDEERTGGEQEKKGEDSTGDRREQEEIIGGQLWPAV